jgi:ABC-type nickel/cobalt efflux system permease component RcnA
MDNLIAVQGWLYSGMASGLGDVAGGDTRAGLVAMAAAVLFGAVHAMMPGHGKTVLVSYHLGQPGRLREGITNGAILTLTHVGLALVLVLAGFAVISKAFAQGGRTPQFEVASGAMVALIGAFLLWRSTRHDHHLQERDGRTLALVTGMIPCPLTTFIMSYALARGLLAAGLVVTAAMALGMIFTIGGIALAAAFARDRFMGLLARTESWRHRVGTVLEVGGSVMVLVFGLWMALRSLTL